MANRRQPARNAATTSTARTGSKASTRNSAHASAATSVGPLAERRRAREQGRRASADAYRRRKRIQRIAISVVVLLVVGIAVTMLIRDRSKPESTLIETGVATPSDPGQLVPDLGGGHVSPDTHVESYNSNPPTSGEHWPTTAQWGVHDGPVASELQVHNLEHGGIVIQYDCPSGCQDVVDRLTQIVEGYPVKLILAPRPGMAHRIALTAWDRLLTMDEINEGQIQAFIDAYIDRGPEKIQSETDLLNQVRP